MDLQWNLCFVLSQILYTDITLLINYLSQSIQLNRWKRITDRHCCVPPPHPHPHPLSAFSMGKTAIKRTFHVFHSVFMIPKNVVLIRIASIVKIFSFSALLDSTSANKCLGIRNILSNEIPQCSEWLRCVPIQSITKRIYRLSIQFNLIDSLNYLWDHLLLFIFVLWCLRKYAAWNSVSFPPKILRACVCVFIINSVCLHPIWWDQTAK